MTAMFRARVARKSREAQDICSFELVCIEGGRLPAFSAGSHIDVALPGGLVRQYSLCNDAAEDHRYLIGVLKDPLTRGGSAALHDQVEEGDVLAISTPRNHFPLVHAARHSIFFAGGIGITPILCMAERLDCIGESFELHYCTRSPERTAFRERIRRSGFASRVKFHHDDGPAEQKLDIARRLAEPEAGVHVYVCGPKGFIDAVLGNARKSGWPEEQLHCEFFGSTPTSSDDDASFELLLASSGRVLRVEPDQTVVQALALAGVDIRTSCEQGVCGTCLTRVLEGEPEHRDLYLTASEQAANDQFLPCCSRAKSSRLVLDL
jgi:vanillate monooxygenase ferredoxin subunit